MLVDVYLFSFFSSFFSFFLGGGGVEWRTCRGELVAILLVLPVSSFFHQEAVLANEILPSVGYSPEDTKAGVTEIQP